jgi:predicted nucleic acid-binding protein
VTFFYIDASAWVKRYYSERGSGHMHQLLSGEDPRVCSVLGLVEVVAALARKCKAREITREDFEAKIAEIERDWRSFVKIELTLDTLDQARDAAARLALRGADAVHFGALVALERRVSNSGHRVVLVTSDRELKEAAEVSGISVLDPETEPTG